MKNLNILFILFCVSFINFNSDASKKVVAVVNGEKIFDDELSNKYKQNQLFVSAKKVNKKKTLENIINRKLGIQRAKKSKLQNNALVKYKMEDVLYHAQISKDLEPLLKGIKVTNGDVKKYYSENREYRTAHILIRSAINMSKKQLKAIHTIAMSAYKKVIKNPRKFSEIANQYSQSLASPNGGDIGFQPSTRLAPEYFQAIKGKSPGYITKPVSTQYGLHIIKVLAVKNYKDINKNLYKKIIYDQKRDKKLEEYYESLRKSAKIKYFK
jgi:parvulin-like peptidyl-prolyl isomerase